MYIDREAILRVFLIETNEGLTRLEESLVGLEAHPESLEKLNDVFRIMHTLKGNAGTLGFPSVSEMAHAVEDILDRLRGGQLLLEAGLVTLLLRSVDTLRQMVVAAVAGAEESFPEQVALLTQLREETPRAALTAAAHDLGERRRSPGRRREDINAFIEKARTLRVDTAKLDRMLDLTGEVAIARGRLKQVIEESGSERLLETYYEMDRLFVDLQELVMKARMVPIGPIFHQFIRLARDVAVSHGKLARLVVEGTMSRST